MYSESELRIFLGNFFPCETIEKNFNQNKLDNKYSLLYMYVNNTNKFRLILQFRKIIKKTTFSMFFIWLVFFLNFFCKLFVIFFYYSTIDGVQYALCFVGHLWQISDLQLKYKIFSKFH